MKQDSKIYVAGNRGLVGSAIQRRLERGGFTRIVTSDVADFDLTDPRATDAFFERERPEHVFLAAAKVGGIAANDDPAEAFEAAGLVVLGVKDKSARKASNFFFGDWELLKLPPAGAGGPGEAEEGPGEPRPALSG